MKDTQEQRRHLWTVVGIVGGGGVVLIVLAKGNGARASAATARAPSSRGGSSPAVAPHSLNFGPNPAQPQLDAAILSAREAALNTYDQSAVAERSAGYQYQLGLNQDETARAIAFNSNATQLKETGIATTAQEAIAQEEAAVQRAQISAQQSVASQYASAQQTQAQGSFWGSILGGIGSFLPFLGFSGLAGAPSSGGAPIQFGSPQYPPTQYAVPDPLPPPLPGFG